MKKQLQAYKFHAPDGPYLIIANDVGEAESEFERIQEELGFSRIFWTKIENLGNIMNDDEFVRQTQMLNES